MRRYFSHITIAFSFVAAFAAVAFPAFAKEKPEKFRDWDVTLLAPNNFLLERPAKRQSAVFSVEGAGDLSKADAEKYILSPKFLKEIKASREIGLFEGQDRQIDVTATREKVGGHWVGVVESVFYVDGRAILMSERIWVRDGLIYHFAIGSKSVVTPSSESHGEIFEEFHRDFALIPTKVSLLNLLVEEAFAGESARSTNGGRGRSAQASASSRPRPPPMPPNCKDRSEIYDVPQDHLRNGGPSPGPTFTMAECGVGARRAVDNMKNAMMRTFSEVETIANRYMEQMKCGPMPTERNDWSFTGVVKMMAGVDARTIWSNCINNAGQAAAGEYALRQGAALVRNVAGAVGGAANYLVTGQAYQTAKRFGNFLQAGGNPLEYIYRHYENQVVWFPCLKPEEQMRYICEGLTNVGVAVGAAATTAGLGAVARGAKIADTLATRLKGLTSTLRRLNRNGSGDSRPNGGNRNVRTQPRPPPARVSTAPRGNEISPPARVNARTTNGGGTRESAPDGGANRPTSTTTTPPTNTASRIASSPTEVLASADEMTVLTNASRRTALGSNDISVLSSTSPGQTLTVSVNRGGTAVSRTVTREEAFDLARDPSITSLKVEGVRPMGTTPRLTAAQANKISPDLSANLGVYSPSSIVQVMVRYRSGEVGIFSGNPQMIRGLAARADVESLDTGLGRPDWIRPSYAIDQGARTGASPLTAMRAQLGEGNVIRSGSELNYGNQTVFHGTVRENVASVRAGPQNVGAGFGGRGLYVALDGDRDLAQTYSRLASQAAENRVRNVRDVADGADIDRTAVIMRGRLNPNREYRVGVFEIDRNAFTPDLRTGRLPANWDDDPRLRELMESEFDVIEVRNARRNGMNISSDRYLVVHERAGADAVTWQRTDLTNRPQRPSAAAAQPLPVNLQNVRMAENSWRENGVPSRNFLTGLNVAERQQYASRVLTGGDFNTRQASGFRRSVGEFKPEYWDDEARMSNFRSSQTESLRRSGFSDEQINTLFDSGAITGARPRAPR